MWNPAQTTEKSIAKKTATIPVRVTIMDAELEFCIERSASGRELFDLVCRSIGLREIWYFGLQVMSNRGTEKWLSFDKKVTKQDAKKCENGYHFYLLVKYYPEDISEELIQDVTQHLFFMQVKQSIINMDIYCPPEACILLASYAVQAQFGDFEENSYKEGFLMNEEEVLPKRVVNQYQMTTDMWEERIKHWWMNNKGLSKEEAEMEYLRIAQDLHMYGITYFSITNKNESKSWLGISAIAISRYEENNKLMPKASFSWSEIGNIYFKDKKFTIKLNGKTAGTEDMTFYTPNSGMNKIILDLCVGNYNLYLRRRQAETLEVQQMKSQAKDDRLRRQKDRHKLEREQNLRILLEREKEKLLAENSQLKEQLLASQEALKKCEETADLLAQKAELSAEEALSLSKKAAEAQVESQRQRLATLKSEEQQVVLEFKAREAEMVASKILDESEKRKKEADRLREELIRARNAENSAKQRLCELMQQNRFSYPYYSPYQTNGFDLQNSPPSATTGQQYPYYYGGYSMPSTSLYSNSNPENYSIPPGFTDNRDIRSLSDEIEKERLEYQQKSRHVQEQLGDLKREIDGLKLDDRQSQLDRLYAEQILQGDDKYSTLRKSGTGSTKTRIALFEGL